VSALFACFEVAMQIARNAVVRIDYVLTDDQQQVLDRSEAGEPLTYLHGARNLITGLENALEGKKAGDQLDVRIPAAEAYGERDDRLVQMVPREMFEDSQEIQIGMQFHSADEEGNVTIVTVTHATDDTVTVDANHPLAGVPLTFSVTVVDVRAATPEELQHGHAHGPGGHHHE
jgi:FKBP-type peptidyl-prolyl cis-trans isomerase SlyD